MDTRDLRLAANAMRHDVIRMLAQSKSGHPGGSLSAADIMTALYFADVLRYDPDDPHDPDRDRFILAKGHGALSLGNVIGANLFNLVLVSGVSVTLAPFSIPQNSTIAGYNASLVLDIPVMLAVMAFLTLPALKRGKLSRFQGVALLLAYGVFCVIQFTI